MRILDLQDDYPLIYKSAIRNRAASDWNKPNEDELSGAFDWDDTPEDGEFWDYINDGYFDNAEAIHPHLFASLKYKYPLGPIKLKTRSDSIYYYYSEDVGIPDKLIKHGNPSALNCTFEIVAYHEEYYIVKVVNQHGDIVTQLGYKEDMLEPVLVSVTETVAKQQRESWSVRYSSSFTEDIFYAMLNYLTNKYGPYSRNDVKLSWEDFKLRYNWFWINSTHTWKFAQDNHNDGHPQLSLQDMLKVINYQQPQREAWCVKNSPKFTKPMFDAMVMYCEKKYGSYQRRDILLSWEKFTNGHSSFFWGDTRSPFLYSQDNHSSSCPIISLDEMLLLIGYKQGIHVEVIKKQPTKPDFTIRRIQPLRVELKTKEFKQIQIIIKSNHVKI